jgi:hypothetical protein
MNAFTDYPITALGDEPRKPAPIRECRVLSYDGDKYCVVDVAGRREEIKAGYLYARPGRSGEAPALTAAALRRLPREPR